ncbi:MAG: MBL fold metallo-hydrolase [Desulfobacterales bacterium]|jgi:ribonuclease BN (tRNA processing enzyme)|nr:MBL fold metallo-hydrolase [Desulfobacterales bacterium]
MPERTPDLRVTILGSGTCVPSLTRSACAVLLESRGAKWLFDCGPGTLRRMLEAGASIFEISHLCVSHLHPDHTADLVPLLFATKYPDGVRRTFPLTLAAGRGFGDFFNRLKAVYGDWIDIGEAMFRIIEMSTDGCDRREMGGLLLETAPMNHSPQSIAFRVTGPGGRSLVYSGDTDFSEALIELAAGADLLICESAFPEGHRAAGHLSPALAGEIAARARVGRLVLTHFYPICDRVDIEAECRRTYSGPLTLAQDLMQLEV